MEESPSLTTTNSSPFYDNLDVLQVSPLMQKSQICWFYIWDRVAAEILQITTETDFMYIRGVFNNYCRFYNQWWASYF